MAKKKSKTKQISKVTEENLQEEGGKPIIGEWDFSDNESKKSDLQPSEESTQSNLPDPMVRFSEVLRELVGEIDQEKLGKSEEWCEENGVQILLSKLVAAYCFHKFGGIVESLKLSVGPPVQDHNETKWVKQYINALYKWAKSRKEKVETRPIEAMIGAMDIDDWFLNESGWRECLIT
ncbi:MAG: hypothetical protein DWQ49_09540 [Bacteroidetes bacterium]|nr:MAG: hypothetical protein DWQ49_09540 [Bacteroidota bacterium]